MGSSVQTSPAGAWSFRLLVTAVLVCTGGNAQAAGFAAARFGGEHGHPTTDNVTAIYYNPAGLALLRGTHIFIDGNLALRGAEYKRDASEISSPGLSDINTLANSGTAELFNVIVSPFAGVASDFGTDFISAGIAWYYPFGGQAVWDERSFSNDDPLLAGATDGVQRWYAIEGTLRSMYLTGAVAFRIDAADLSIGVSGSLIRSQMHTIRARNADGTDDIHTDTDPRQIKEGRSYLDANGWHGGFGVGLLWEPIRDTLWVGASYQSQPGVSGGTKMEGTLTNVLATGDPSDTKVEVEQSLPDIIRLGARWRPTPDSEVRLFGDWTRWSVLERHCLLDKSVSGRKCGWSGYDKALDDPESFGGPEPDVIGVTQHLPRIWNDTFGVRAGGSYWFIPGLEGYIGAGYDSTAIPDETIDPALIDAHKITASLGVRWQVIDNLALNLGYTQVIYLTVDTEGKSALDRFAGQTRQPTGDGEYSQWLSLVNLYADISF